MGKREEKRKGKEKDREKEGKKENSYCTYIYYNLLKLSLKQFIKKGM